MDFQSSISGGFDDDRVGWTVQGGTADSSQLFGVQLDPDDAGGLNVEGYWDGATVNLRPHIVDLTGLIQADSWYRLHLEVHKLTPTAARLQVELHELDSSCVVVALVASGEISDTRDLGVDAPALSYFTAAQMWPSYKNYESASGAADNASFEVLP